MEEDINIDELLNSYLDGELTQRHQTEVGRLISHDAEVAKRLRELEKCKMMVSSLPYDEAPAGMAEQIKASLKRRAIIGQRPHRIEQRAGARHLLVRKVLTAAAVIVLATIFGGVIYTILAPQPVKDEPIAVEDMRRIASEVKVERPEPSIVATAEKSISEAVPTAAEFNGRLELTTSALIAVDAAIKRAIEENYLLEKVSSETRDNERVYALSCGREALSLLLSDLGNIWSRLDSAVLIVESERIDEQILVESVTTEQIAKLVNQDSFQERIAMAKDFAVFNKMSELLPGREVFAVVEDRRPALISIPKPVLTSSEKAVKKLAQAEDRGKVHLAIVVVGR